MEQSHRVIVHRLVGHRVRGCKLLGVYFQPVSMTLSLQCSTIMRIVRELVAVIATHTLTCCGCRMKGFVPSIASSAVTLLKRGLLV